MVSKNKKILFVVSSLRRGGGAENSVSIIIKELKNKGHNVELLTFYKFKDEYDIGKVKHYSFKFKYQKNSLIKAFYLFKLFPIKFKLFLKKNKYDLIISNAEDANLVSSITNLISIKKFKLYLVVRNNNLIMFNPIYKKFSLKLHKKANKIITVSQALQEDFKILGLKNIDYIYNPLDFNDIAQKLKEDLTKKEKEIFQKNKVILMIGRFAKQKNYLFLIDSFSDLLSKTKIQNIKLVILGEGELEIEIKNYINKKNIQNKVFFLGIKKNVFTYMKNSYAYVLPSNHEGFPRVLLESLATGLPSIANNCVSGPAEILDETLYVKFDKKHNFKKAKFGFLVPFNDRLQFTNAMKYLLENPNSHKHYQKEAKIRAKDFDIKSIVKKWEKILK